ncbi:MAG TPA: PAS domain-containing protein, partial [Thermodesulfovibrionales bacterium]|nr:PAS domain-containing protein [Thermodesulfovibrionales bacterium]
RVVDKDFNILKANETFARMSGFDRESLTGKKCYDMFPGPACHTDQCSLVRVLGGEERIEFESIKVRRDGGEVACIVTATPLKTPSGELTGIVEDFRDITERKKAEEALRESEERSRAKYQGIPIPTYVLQRKGYDFVLTDCNRAAEEITEGKVSEVLGMKLSDIYKDAPEIIDDVWKCYKGKTIIRKEIFYKFRMINKEKFFCVHYSYAPPDFVLAHTQDITDLKRVEDEVMGLKQQIEFVLGSTKTGLDIIDSEYNIRYIDPESQKPYGNPDGRKCYEYFRSESKRCRECGVATALQTRTTVVSDSVLPCEGDRPVQITSMPFQGSHGEWLVAQVVVDLRERKRMEDEHLKVAKLESLGILAGGIAHDFNNILTAILGSISFTKLCLKEEDDAFEALTVAEQASLRAKDLTRRLLTFSKGGEPIRRVVSIQKLVRNSAVFVLSGSASRCEYEFKNDLYHVEVDEGQVSQVFNNILINAVQACPGGGVITVEAENLVIEEGNLLSLRPGKYVKVSIHDQGMGIAQENLEKIFDPYFTTKPTGSGLGLTTAYSVVEKHNGHIHVESEPGSGATFSVYLPASEAEVLIEPKEDRLPLTGKGSVLVMDDEEVLRNFAGRMLKKAGYNVSAATDGIEALDLYKQARETGKPFDVVILDLTVPGGAGGKETIQRLLQIDPEIKAIVSSGYSNDPIMANYRQYGFKAVVEKPYSIVELTRTIESVMSGNDGKPEETV